MKWIPSKKKKKILVRNSKGHLYIIEHLTLIALYAECLLAAGIKILSKSQFPELQFFK